MHFDTELDLLDQAQNDAELLADDGVMLLHSIGRSEGPNVTNPWIAKYIFPGGYIPALSELVKESEKAGWQIMDVEAMRFHYSHTLEEWYNRTVMHKDEIVDLYDETFYRMWQFYLLAAAGASRSRDGQLYQMVLVTVRLLQAQGFTRQLPIAHSDHAIHVPRDTWIVTHDDHRQPQLLVQPAQ